MDDDPYERPTSRKSGGRFGLDDNDDDTGKFSSRTKSSTYSSRFKKDDDVTTGSRFSKSPSRYKYISVSSAAQISRMFYLPKASDQHNAPEQTDNLSH